MKVRGQEGRKFSPRVFCTKTEPSSLKIRNFDFSQFSCFHTSAISIILKFDATGPRAREFSGLGLRKLAFWGSSSKKKRFNPMFFGFGASRAEKKIFSSIAFWFIFARFQRGSTPFWVVKKFFTRKPRLPRWKLAKKYTFWGFPELFWFPIFAKTLASAP